MLPQRYRWVIKIYSKIIIHFNKTLNYAILHMNDNILPLLYLDKDIEIKLTREIYKRQFIPHLNSKYDPFVVTYKSNNGKFEEFTLNKTNKLEKIYYPYNILFDFHKCKICKLILKTNRNRKYITYNFYINSGYIKTIDIYLEVLKYL